MMIFTNNHEKHPLTNIRFDKLVRSDATTHFISSVTLTTPNPWLPPHSQTDTMMWRQTDLTDLTAVNMKSSSDPNLSTDPDAISAHIRNLGVTFDQTLSLHRLVEHITKIAFSHLENVARLGPSPFLLSRLLQKHPERHQSVGTGPPRKTSKTTTPALEVTTTLTFKASVGSPSSPLLSKLTSSVVHYCCNN